MTVRARSKGDIDLALSQLALQDVDRLVVHYVGHGESHFDDDDDYDTGDRPALALDGLVRKTIVVPSLGRRVQVLVKSIDPSVPDLRSDSQLAWWDSVKRNGHDNSTEYLTRELVDRIATLFAHPETNQGSIPPVFIMDGCYSARTLDYHERVNIVTAIDVRFGGVSLAAFSDILRRHVTPDAFDYFNSEMPEVIANVNSAFRSSKSPAIWNVKNDVMTEDLTVKLYQQAAVATRLRPAVARDPRKLEAEFD